MTQTALAKRQAGRGCRFREVGQGAEVGGQVLGVESQPLSTHL